MSMINFPCTRCGCCCKRINVAVKNLGANNPHDELFFPYHWDETGKCEKLTEDNKCSIYDTRPLVCNINKIGEKINIEMKEFYNMNIVACNTMMDEDDIPQSFRINLIP